MNFRVKGLTRIGLFESSQIKLI